MILEGFGVDVEEGLFVVDFFDGEGCKGCFGRMMVLYGWGFWFEQCELMEGWVGEVYFKLVGGLGMLVGVV